MLPALLALPLLLSWGWYLWGNSALPAKLAPNRYRAPAGLAEQYLRAEADGVTEIPRLNPASYFWLVHRGRHDLHTQARLRLLGNTSRIVSLRDPRHTLGLRRHAAEMAGAIRISRHWSLDEIVGTALSESWYGHGATGFEAAALAYYGLPPAQLLPEESLALIALLRGPAYYDPYCHGERFQARYRLLAQRLHLPAEAALQTASRRLLPAQCPQPHS